MTLREAVTAFLSEVQKTDLRQQAKSLLQDLHGPTSKQRWIGEIAERNPHYGFNAYVIAQRQREERPEERPGQALLAPEQVRTLVECARLSNAAQDELVAMLPRNFRAAVNPLRPTDSPAPELLSSFKTFDSVREIFESHPLRTSLQQLEAPLADRSDVFFLQEVGRIERTINTSLRPPRDWEHFYEHKLNPAGRQLRRALLDLVCVRDIIQNVGLLVHHAVRNDRPVAVSHDALFDAQLSLGQATRRVNLRAVLPLSMKPLVIALSPGDFVYIEKGGPEHVPAGLAFVRRTRLPGSEYMHDYGATIDFECAPIGPSLTANAVPIR